MYELNEYLFTDIETVAMVNSFEELDADYKALWEKQVNQSYKGLLEEKKTVAEIWKLKAALHPEFARIAVIGMGYLLEEEKKEEGFTLKVKTLYNDSEVNLLNQFKIILNKKINDAKAFKMLVGHNVKKFDFPFLFKKFVQNGIAVPDQLNYPYLDKFKTPHIDTMELWSCNQYSFPSLDLLSKTLNIPMKDILKGELVHDTFYKENNQKKISNYCAGDVAAVARIFLKIYGANVNIKQMVLV